MNKCCVCGSTENLREAKDVTGGDDWDWWCKECFGMIIQVFESKPTIHKEKTYNSVLGCEI